MRAPASSPVCRQADGRSPGSAGTGTASHAFVYGPEYQRVRQTIAVASGPNAGTTTHWYAGGFERETRTADNTTQVRVFLPQGVVLIDRYTSASANVTTAADSRQLRYCQRDRLGSTTAVTDEAGSVLERQFYDPWGQRRNGDGSASLTLQSRDHRYGYTEHDMLDAIGLVHMNGRIYDPLLARFMSADPTIPDPSDGQNYNRYSYVLNSPTNYTDPSGFAQVRQVELTGNWGNSFTGSNLNGPGGWGARMSWAALAEIPKFDEEGIRSGRRYERVETPEQQRIRECNESGRWFCYRLSNACQQFKCLGSDSEGSKERPTLDRVVITCDAACREEKNEWESRNRSSDRMLTANDVASMFMDVAWGILPLTGLIDAYGQWQAGDLLGAGISVLGEVPGLKQVKGTVNAIKAVKKAGATIGPNKPFSRAQKRGILAANRERNGGQLTSDKSGTPLVPSAKSESGVTPPSNEAQVDHIRPKSKGGTNLTVSQMLSSASTATAWTSGVVDDECEAQLVAQGGDRIRHVPLRAPDSHAGCNLREGKRLGVR